MFHFVLYDMTVSETTPWNFSLKLALANFWQLRASPMFCNSQILLVCHPAKGTRYIAIIKRGHHTRMPFRNFLIYLMSLKWILRKKIRRIMGVGDLNYWFGHAHRELDYSWKHSFYSANVPASLLADGQKTLGDSFFSVTVRAHNVLPWAPSASPSTHQHPLSSLPFPHAIVALIIFLVFLGGMHCCC
jgi:hypothetical protein